MDGKAKFMVILLASILASVLTSYAVTSFYLANQPYSAGTVTADNLSPQAIQQIADDLALSTAKTNVSLPFEVHFNAHSDSYIITQSRITLENLTITYQYIKLSDGTTQTESIDYGTFIPAWGAGVTIEPGATPEAIYKIPDYIIQQSSTIISNGNGCEVFEKEPAVTVVGVFGYA